MTLLLTIAGCASSEITPAQSEESVQAKETKQPKETNAELSADDEIPEGYWAGIVIKDIENKKFKNDILKELDTSRSMSKKQRQDDIDQRIVKAQNIEKFYNLDKFKIDGYELYEALITRGMFLYKYAPLNPSAGDLDVDGNYVFNYDTGIQLQIKRFDYEYGDIPSRVTIEQLADIFEGKVINNSFFCVETPYNYNEFGGLLGDTWFDIKAPKSVDFNSLPNIGRQLIKSAELVDVERELDVMRNSTD